MTIVQDQQTTIDSTSASLTADGTNGNSANGSGPHAVEAEAAWLRNARLFLEDFIVTLLLRQGRALKSTELSAAAGESGTGFRLSRALLQQELISERLTESDREWDLTTRVSRKGRSREERERQPVESTIRELLANIGKPLPVPVIAREVALMRGFAAPNAREVVTQVLNSAHWAVEMAPGVWLHESLALETGAGREELIVRENQLAASPDFQSLRNVPQPETSAGRGESLASILRAANRPLPIKVLCFLLWKQDPSAYDSRAVLEALSERAMFHNFIGGYVSLQSQMPAWRDDVMRWNQELTERGGPPIDVPALLRQRLAPTETVTAEPSEIADIKEYGRSLGSGQPIALASVMTELLEMDPTDERFVGVLQGLNDALRRDTELLPVGVGRFLLRESVPPYVGEVPAELRPVQLSIRDPETDEPLDFEMSDDGLEGDAPEFVHAPQWEDVNEEVEVKLPRRVGNDAPMTTRYVILNPHHQAGTIKLRRMDEDFFALEGGLARIAVRVEGDEPADLHAWASRESGLIYGLGEYFGSRTPESGGVLEFTRSESPNAPLKMKLESPDKLTHIDSGRAEDLEKMRQASPYTSLFDLLQTIMSNHQNGAELPTLWAEVNMVRRTTKRLVCSVLSGYHCFYFKQRGPKQILWRYDAGKLDQGFKRNKRKYVRR